MKRQMAAVLDPVCGMQVDLQDAAVSRERMGQTYYFCSQDCAQEFDRDPYRYLRQTTMSQEQHSGHSGCC